jgi:hypothetical protein
MPIVMWTYTIYHNPANPENMQYAIRPTAIHDNRSEPRVGDIIAYAATLEEIREAIPIEAGACFPRDVSDDPQVVETWL